MLSTKHNASDKCRDVATIGPTNPDNSALQPFAHMPKNMMDEMDKRRALWEKDVERMAEDFFQVKLAKLEGETTHRTSEEKSLLCLPDISTTTTSSENSQRQKTTPIMKTTSATVSSSSGTGNDVTSLNDDNAYRHHHEGNTQPEYYRDDEQTTWCRLRFDVRGYEPGEISVRVEGNRKLIVCARHVQSAAESSTGTDTITRQMNKTVDVPRGARPDRITSFLSKDGYLTVLAPVNDAQPDQNCIGGGLVGELPDTKPRSCEFRPIRHQQPPSLAATKLSETTSFESAARDSGISNRNIVKTDDGDLMLKIVVDLGRSDYEPDDVTVQFYPDIVRVNALHEQLTPLKPNSNVFPRDSENVAPDSGVAAPVQMLRHEFARDFDLPSAASNGSSGVVPSTVRVTLGPDGRLWIGASLEVNVEPASHRRIAGHVVQMMPRNGRPCQRIEIVG